MKKCSLLCVMVQVFIVAFSLMAAAQPPADQVDQTTNHGPIPCTIVFDSDRDGNQEIYRMEPDGSGLKNLTNNPAWDREPAWSPDGSQLVFVSDRPTDGEGGNYLYIMQADGTNLRKLTVENDCGSPDWSPDSSQIIYANEGDIYLIMADGSQQSRNLTNSPEQDMNPVWSPDGIHIAWLSGKDGKWDIFMMNADGSNWQQLTNNSKVSDVAWTIDGEIFTHWDQPDGICFNCVMRSDGSDIRDAGGKGELQRYTPFRTLDGVRVECVSIDIIQGNEEIYLVSEFFPDIFLNLTNAPGNDRNPDWPANCLAGFEGALSDMSVVPEIETVLPQNERVLGYVGKDPAQWQRREDFQIACEELDVQCVYGEISELLDQNVSAVILDANNGITAEMTTAIREAAQQGVPVFVLDEEIDIPGTYSVLADRGQVTSMTLKTLLKKSAGSGDFAYFDFSTSQKDAQLMKDVLEKEYPQINVVTTDCDRYNFVDDPNVFNDLMIDYPALKAVWTNSGYIHAVFGVVNNISSPENYPILNCEPSKDGLFIWLDRTIEHPGFECIIAGSPPGVAYDAAYIASYLLSGEKLNPSTPGGQYGNAFQVNFPVITNETLDEWIERIRFENVDAVPDLLMTPGEIREKWFSD